MMVLGLNRAWGANVWVRKVLYPIKHSVEYTLRLVALGRNFVAIFSLIYVWYICLSLLDFLLDFFVGVVLGSCRKAILANVIVAWIAPRIVQAIDLTIALATIFLFSVYFCKAHDVTISTFYAIGTEVKITRLSARVGTMLFLRTLRLAYRASKYVSHINILDVLWHPHFENSMGEVLNHMIFMAAQKLVLSTWMLLKCLLGGSFQDSILFFELLYGIFEVSDFIKGFAIALMQHLILFACFVPAFKTV